MNNKAYNRQLLTILSSIPADKQDRFINNYAEQAHNPTIILGFNIWLGWLGVDRFVLGQPGLGLLKLITIGGFGVWNLIDHFMVGGIARQKNIDIAMSISNSI